MKSALAVLIIVLIILTSSLLNVSNAQAPDREKLLKMSWRNYANEHYYQNACCYCRQAEAVRPSELPNHSDYLVSGVWFTMPDSMIRPPDPEKPTRGTIICDPVMKEYQCVIDDSNS